MSRGPAIGLIDGEHHPAAVRESLDRLDGERGVAAVVFCGGEEKLRREVLERPEVHYGRAVAVEDDAAAALRRAARESAAATVVDLADEPVLTGARRLRLAALALSLGLDYEAPGTSLRAPRYERLGYAGPKLAVIATGKRTGKTALAGHWAMLLRERGLEPVIVCMGRGGPAEPQLAEPGISLEELVAIAEEGRHAASDYLEGAMLAGVTTVGCRRVGGGLAGEPHASNVSAGARLAAERSPGAIVFESSGACVPPVQVDRTLCLVREREEALGALGPYRIMRAGLALVMDPAEERLAAEVADFCPGPVMRCALRPEPAEELPGDARVALFSTGAGVCEGLEPVVSSDSLARRAALEADLDRAASERCDVYLTELKAAAIDTVAARALREGARVVFVRNRPVGVGGDLDAALMELYEGG